MSWLASIGVLLSSVAWGASAIPPVRGVNVPPGDLEILSSFLTSSYEHFSGLKVSAVIEGADEIIEATAFGLGSGGGPPILLRVQRHTATGEVIAQTELRVETLDEAPKVCDRIAETLVRKVPLDSTQTRHNVAQAETRQETRIGTEKILGVKLGFGIPVASGQSFTPVGALQFDARFERNMYFFEIGGGILVPGPGSSTGSTGYGGLVAELGASRYLTDGDIAVYAGAGVMPRLIFGGFSDSPLNLAPYLQGGVMFDRASSTRIYADVRVAQNVLAVKTMGPLGTQSHYPTELTLQIGIGW